MTKLQIMRAVLREDGASEEKIDRTIAQAGAPPDTCNDELTEQEAHEFREKMRRCVRESRLRNSLSGAKVRVWDGMTKVDVIKQVLLATGQTKEYVDFFIEQARHYGLIKPDMDEILPPGTEQAFFNEQDARRVRTHQAFESEPMKCLMKIVEVMLNLREKE